MSAATSFETVPGTRIPVYPAPSIFETTVGRVEHTAVIGGVEVKPHYVTHTDVEVILSRSPWDFTEADDRLRGERIAALQKEVDAVAKKAAARPAKKTAKKTPRKKP